MAVVMALQSAPIYRLEKTWTVRKYEHDRSVVNKECFVLQALSKRDRTTFNHLKDFVSADDNWKQLRKHFSMNKLPCIPYLGKEK